MQQETSFYFKLVPISINYKLCIEIVNQTKFNYFD